MVNLVNQIDRVGLLTDSCHINQNEEILSVLSGPKITAELIIAPGDIKSLLDISLWQNFARVFINLPNKHPLSSGRLQGFLDLLNLNYTGSSMLASALAVNRLNTKKIWQITGIATTNFLKWRPNINWEEIAGLFGFPMAVKSLHAYDHKIFKVINIEQLQQAIEKFPNLLDVILEPWVTGEEYEVYIVGDKALYPIPVNADTAVDDYSNIKPYILRMQKLALDALAAIGGQGPAKVNIIMDLNQDCWVSSIDTSPVVTRNNNFSKSASCVGINFETLLKNILMTSFAQKTNYNNLNFYKSL